MLVFKRPNNVMRWDIRRSLCTRGRIHDRDQEGLQRFRSRLFLDIIACVFGETMECEVGVKEDQLERWIIRIIISSSGLGSEHAHIVAQRYLL